MEALWDLGVQPEQDDAFDLMRCLMALKKPGWREALSGLAARVDLAKALGPQGHSPLALAARHGDEDAARALLGAYSKAGPAALDAKNDDGWSALHWAAQGSPGLVLDLVEAGASDFADKMDRTALCWAAKRGWDEAVSALLRIPRRAPRQAGASALVAASTNENWGCAKLLLADPEEGAQERKDEALVWCSRKGLLDSMRLLLDAGADPKRASKKNHSKTALMLAAHGGMVEAGKILAPISDVEAVDAEGSTALQIAKRSSPGEEFARWLEGWIVARDEAKALEEASAQAARAMEKPRL